MRLTNEGVLPDRYNAIAHDWFRFIDSVLPDAILIPLPNHKKTVEELLDKCMITSIILSGGEDWGSAHERDHVEEFLVQKAVRQRWPLLGVCRGMQVINILLGGRIEKDIAEATGSKHVSLIHPVKLSHAAFSSLSLSCNQIEVNSYHNQGILTSRVGSGLKAFATAENEVVEACYHADYPMIGIQWHPERPNPAAVFDASMIRKFFEEGKFWE